MLNNIDPQKISIPPCWVMFMNEKLLGWNKPTPNDKLDIGICVFPYENSLNGLEDDLDSMGVVGKNGCDVIFPIDVLDNFGIQNVNIPIILCENKLDELDPPIGLNVKGVDIMHI